MSAPASSIDDHDPMAAVCGCDWCQPSSKLERADAVVTEIAREEATWLLVRAMMATGMGGLLLP